jgi:hypothetical protein
MTEVVQLVGLSSSQSLNGAIGTVTADDDYEAKGMYRVDLQSPAAAVAAYPSGINLDAMNLLKLPLCAQPDCDGIGTKACSTCFKESYWNTHKIMCKLIKQMPDKLLPFENVCLVAFRTFKLRKQVEGSIEWAAIVDLRT